jgi:hypothetical protein
VGWLDPELEKVYMYKLRKGRLQALADRTADRGKHDFTVGTKRLEGS